MAEKYEFRFVVAGTRLSEEHQETLANAVAQAGAIALAGMEFENPKSAVSFIPRDWLGRWLHVLEPNVAGELGKQLGIESELTGFAGE
jgi:hypothetical protein